jgi:hypothetical protein
MARRVKIRLTYNSIAVLTSVSKWGCPYFSCALRKHTYHFLSTSINSSSIRTYVRGHFTHETKSPWPLQCKHSHWWKRWNQSKFIAHYAWGTNRVCECKMDVKSTWIPTWHPMNHVSWSLGLFQKPPLGGRPNANRGDMALRMLTTVDF